MRALSTNEIANVSGAGAARAAALGFGPVGIGTLPLPPISVSGPGALGVVYGGPVIYFSAVSTVSLSGPTTLRVGIDDRTAGS